LEEANLKNSELKESTEDLMKQIDELEFSIRQLLSENENLKDEIERVREELSSEKRYHYDYIVKYRYVIPLV